MPPNTTTQTETARLEQIMASRMVGICYLDADGRLVQLLDGDLALRDAIIEYQKQRIRELMLSHQPMSPLYPVLAE